MGDLISMTRSATAFPVRPHTGGDAEILFFTGVRYHRLDDDAPARTITHSRRRAEKERKAADMLRPDHQA
jgi:hypothetical protein